MYATYSINTVPKMSDWKGRIKDQLALLICVPFEIKLVRLFIRFVCLPACQSICMCARVSMHTSYCISTSSPPDAAPNTMRAAPNLCYVGDHSIVLSEASHLLDCAAMCADLSKCTGINYRPRGRQCQLVYEVVDRNPRLMGAENGCTFWKIIQAF